MPNANGKYLLRMEQYVNPPVQSGSERKWTWASVAKQSYGSLSSAQRDADAYVKAGNRRRANVIHVAPNGTESAILYVVGGEVN